MAAGDTSVSFARTEANKFYSTKWLKYASKNLVFQKYGRMERMPARVGKKIRFKFITAPTTSTAPVPLVEGVTPDPINLSRSEVLADVVEFGNWLQETNIMRELFEDANNLTDLQNTVLGTIMVEERDVATFNIVRVGTNVQYANGVANRALVIDPLSVNDLHLASRTLKNGLAGRAGKPIRQIMRPDGRFGTVGIEPSYVAVINPDMEFDVRELAGFSSVESYGQGNGETGEFGKVNNFRFVMTTISINQADSGLALGGANILSTTGANADVYLMMLFAEDGYANITVAGRSSSALIRKGLGVGGDDALNQRGSVGYRMYFAAAILYQERILRLECAATAVPGA